MEICHENADCPDVTFFGERQLEISLDIAPGLIADIQQSDLL